MPAIPEIRSDGEPRVLPRIIFAAGHDKFEAVVPDTDNPRVAKIFIFNQLPLAASGWDYDTAKISRAGKTWDGHPIWRLER